MHALLGIFVRVWLWLLPERGRALLGWERSQHTLPNGRAAGRWGCAVGCTASSPGTLCAAEPSAAAAFPQHALAASPGPLTRRRLLLLLSSQDCPPLLNTWWKSLGWHRACPLAHMAELEQAPGRAELLLEEDGCGGQQEEDCCPEWEEGALLARDSCPVEEAPPAGCARKSPQVVEGCPGDLDVLAQRGSGMVSEVGGLYVEDGAGLAMGVRGEACSGEEAPVAGSSRAPGAGREQGDGTLAEIGSVGGSSDGVAGCRFPVEAGNMLPVAGSLDVGICSEVGGSSPVTKGDSLGPEATGEVKGLCPGVTSEGVRLDPGPTREVGSANPRFTCGLGSGDRSEVTSLAPELGSHVHITVAIEEVEDDDMESAFLGTLEGGGNCSEDDRNDKYSGAATSGGENDSEDLDPNWMPPEQDLIEKLIVQIEYYLSDENLEKDAFLLKHVRRNKMGYVSVKLLTSFKKVKHLTRDWRTTAYALRYSDTLELNEDNRKIRRKSPVPVFPSENLPSKMLLVYDFHLFPELQALNKEQENGGMQEKIMEQLLKVFGSFGVISSVRILKPGRDLPPDVKRLSSRYTQVGTKECAIVEYEEVEAAIKAHEAMGLVKENEVGMKVILIGMKPPKKKIPKDKIREDDSNKNRKAKSLNKRVEELQYTGDESPVSSSSDPDSNPTSPMVERKYKASNKLSPSTYQNNHLSPNASPRSSPWNSPSGQRKVGKISPLADGTSPEFPRKCIDYSSDSSITPSSSPWVQRRRQAQTVTQEKSPVGSPMLGRKIQNADGLPLGVLRLPRGPDGTKGFHNGIERNKTMQNLVKIF